MIHGGDVGIINVITKKNFGEGLSGVINLSGNTVWSRTLDFLLTGQNKASQWRIGGYVGNRLRKSHFTQEKTTLVNDTTTTSYSNGPRESNGYAYILNGGWSYTQKQTTFSINAEGGYAGLKRKGDLEYTEERSANGEQFENGEFKSLDDFDIHETFGLGNLAVDHKFNDKGHNLSGSFFLKYGGDALEYFQSDLFDEKQRTPARSSCVGGRTSLDRPYESRLCISIQQNRTNQGGLSIFLILGRRRL